jgi:hypothetical protein
MKKKCENEVEDEKIEEFSTTGAVAGMILPLGMSPSTKKPKKKSQRKKTEGAKVVEETIDLLTDLFEI